MKFRNGFVTNSSSSSFIVSIKIETVDGREISFYGNGGTPESGRIDYFECDAGITASPKKMGRAKDVEELIAILTEGVIDCNEWCDEDQHIKIFEKSNPVGCEAWDDDGECEGVTFDAYDFVKEIREKVKSMDDIAKIFVSGEEENYRTYTQEYTYDRVNDKYTGYVFGCEFEKDGASGGYVSMPDLDECEVTYEEDSEWD